RSVPLVTSFLTSGVSEISLAQLYFLAASDVNASARCPGGTLLLLARSFTHCSHSSFRLRFSRRLATALKELLSSTFSCKTFLYALIASSALPTSWRLPTYSE